MQRLSKFSQFKLVHNETKWTGLERSVDRITLDLPHDAQVCATGLSMPTGLLFEQWEDVGRQLMTLESGIQWALGDWWAYGHHAYGKRAKAAEKLPYEFGTLMNLGTVARKFPTSLRNEALSFSHHAVVAGLEEKERTKWLKKAAGPPKWSVQFLRKELAKKGANQKTDYERARMWTNDLIDRAKRQRIGAFGLSLSDKVLDTVEDSLVNELVEVSTTAAANWTEFADQLKSYRDVRERRSNTKRVPRERLEDEADTLQAAE